LFEEHEALVTRLINGDSHDRDEDDVGAATNPGNSGTEQARLLAHESAKAVNAGVIALLLRLGPPPKTSTTDPYAPVSDGGGTTE
jgi:hypothetical protein